MMFKRSLCAIVGGILALTPVNALLAEGLSHEQLAKIRQQLKDRAHVSWEYGTAVQALLEIDHPELSVFGSAPFPPPYPLEYSGYTMTNAQFLMDTHPEGVMAIMEDGAAGDPMSNGITLLLANFTNPDDPRFSSGFESQLKFIEEYVPKSSEGAISHRVSELQLWADSMYMVPPVLAYWGALHPGTDTEKDYLIKAYEQIKLYREALRDPSAGNVYLHIVWGSWEDRAPWATGQAWALGGILRVYQTIAKSTRREELSWALADLLAWAEELVGATWAYQKADGSLFNYLNRDDSFMDMSSTAFMAALTYRLAVITDATQYIPNADRAFALVKNSIADDGRLMNVVNPYNFSQHYDDVSPEGQAMVLMCQAAYRDYQQFSGDIGDSLSGVFNAFAAAIAAAKET